MNREFPVSGGKVGFRVDPTPYDAFKTALEDEGFAKHCPNPRTDHSALVAVTGKAAGKDCKVVPRKKPKVNGVEVVRVDKHEHSANDYSTEMHTKVVGKAVYTDYGRDYTLTEEFLKTKAVLTAGAITKALKSILCDELHGLPDFDSRRIYVPEASLPRWNELAARLFGATTIRATWWPKASAAASTSSIWSRSTPRPSGRSNPPWRSASTTRRCGSSWT